MDKLPKHIWFNLNFIAVAVLFSLQGCTPPPTSISRDIAREHALQDGRRLALRNGALVISQNSTWTPLLDQELPPLVDIAFRPAWPSVTFQGSTYSAPVHAFAVDHRGAVTRIVLSSSGKVLQIRELMSPQQCSTPPHLLAATSNDVVLEVNCGSQTLEVKVPAVPRQITPF